MESKANPENKNISRYPVTKATADPSSVLSKDVRLTYHPNLFRSALKMMSFLNKPVVLLPTSMVRCNVHTRESRTWFISKSSIEATMMISGVYDIITPFVSLPASLIDNFLFPPS